MKPILVYLSLIVGFGVTMPSWGFEQAQPVWIEGREEELNLFAGFRASLAAGEGDQVVVRCTASTAYRLFLNGDYVGAGPARGPHGFFRVDEWDVSSKARPGENMVAFEVAGYNANSYGTLDQPSFLQAEVIRNGKVSAFTGGEGNGFEALVLDQRVQKVERYSFQRAFTEVYRLSPGWDLWRTSRQASGKIAKVEVLEARKGIPRRVPYPTFEKRAAVRWTAAGTLQEQPLPEKPWKPWGLTAVGPEFNGFPEAELESASILEIQKFPDKELEPLGTAYNPEPVEIPAMHFRIADFGTNLSGFPGAVIRCTSPTVLYMTFDEMLSEGDVNYKRLGCANVITWDLQPGTYAVEAFEPYTMRFLKLQSTRSACEVLSVYLREYANPDVWEANFASPDSRLNQLFTAARETFRQNAVDVFMDCPHRERAGWLCDSFFTSRVAFDLSGDTRVEKAFLENYLLPDHFEHLPAGMLPMCYPSDHTNGNFIPNWAMWFVVQLEEYQQRCGDRELVDALRPRVLALFDYFKPFINSDGLLEGLEKWVFVEWSKANDFVQDVNYPTNMLYAAALSAASRLYGLPDLEKQAEKMRATIRTQSFDGEFFVDNAVRKDGTLEATRNRTEVCQYFAFYFGVATPESHARLWETLCSAFGPGRKESGAYPEIFPANSFVGNVMRLELLSQAGKCRQLLDESVGYNHYMAERTGTLWENIHSDASCNHGFASHVAHTLFRDVLGIYRIDPVAKRIVLRFTDIDLPWCEGRIPFEEGAVTVRWQQSEKGLIYDVERPEGYQLVVENPGGKKVCMKETVCAE